MFNILVGVFTLILIIISVLTFNVLFWKVFNKFTNNEFSIDSDGLFTWFFGPTLLTTVAVFIVVILLYITNNIGSFFIKIIGGI